MCFRRTRDTEKIWCPDCGEPLVQAVAKEKASCRKCGNVWAWKRRRTRVIGALREAG